MPPGHRPRCVVGTAPLFPNSASPALSRSLSHSIATSSHGLVGSEGLWAVSNQLPFQRITICHQRRDLKACGGLVTTPIDRGCVTLAGVLESSLRLSCVRSAATYGSCWVRRHRARPRGWRDDENSKCLFLQSLCSRDERRTVVQTQINDRGKFTS